jgi:hypothetical protein
MFDAYGYLPGTGDNAFLNVPHSVHLFRNGSVDDRFSVNVPDTKANRYFYALAAGTWKQVAEIKVATSGLDFGVVASGTWGKLRREQVGPANALGSPPRRRSRRSQTPIEYVYEAPPEPRVFAGIELKAYDDAGSEMRMSPVDGERYQVPADLKNPISRLIIETRPYTWIEFDDIRFDPDMSKWTNSYIGTEGDKAIAKDHSGRYAIVGIGLPAWQHFDPIPTPTFGPLGFGGRADAAPSPGEAPPDARYFDPRSSTVYAPDGKLWRAFPHRRDIGYAANSVTAGKPLNAEFAAVVHLHGLGERPKFAPRIDVFASMSGEPGKRLGELTATAEMAYHERQPGNPDQDGEYQVVAFDAPKTTRYVQLRVRPGTGEWQTVGTFQPPGPLVHASAQDLSQMRAGTISWTVVRLVVRPGGWLDEFYSGPDRSQTYKKMFSRWPSDAGSVRILARLKSGETVPLQLEHTFGYDPEYDFELTMDSEASQKGSKILLSQVDHFEVQAMVYGKSTYLVAKLPNR